eukprot:scaffold762_cov363-Pavlova_lutheri.AAC.63
MDNSQGRIRGPARSGPSIGEPSSTAVSHPGNAIVASRRQQGNPLLQYIKNVRVVYGDIVADYQIGEENVALFLSLKYHLLHRNYLIFRLRELQRSFRVRILLCYVDTPDPVNPLGEVIKACIFQGFTLVCAWSYQECARYLETFKSYESKPADNIQERIGHDYLSRLNAVLTSIRGINKTDVLSLGTQTGSLANAMKATSEELASCPGIGPTKVKRLREVFHMPFRREQDGARASNTQNQLNFRPKRLFCVFHDCQHPNNELDGSSPCIHCKRPVHKQCVARLGMGNWSQKNKIPQGIAICHECCQ